MKALTLHQPWASLIAVGAKTIETRGWSTSYRGPLAIHAGKRMCNNERWPLPLGVVVAVVDLVDVVPILPVGSMLHNGEHRVFASERPNAMGEQLSLTNLRGGPAIDITAQAPFGDFTPGRFAWLLNNVRPLDEPIPAKGKQGLWTWDVTASLLWKETT